MSASASKTTTQKIVLIGAASCGKTAMLRRYVDDIYSEDVASTVGVTTKLPIRIPVGAKGSASACERRS